MNAITKEETLRVMDLLKCRGWTREELAVKLGKCSQTIWRWGAKSEKQAKSIPDKSDYEALLSLTEED